MESGGTGAASSWLSHQYLEAVAAVLWPIIALVLLLRLFPLIKGVVESRAFTVRIGGMEVSVQDATEKLRSQIDDLQKKVIELRSIHGEPALAGREASPKPAAARSKTLLWVDDKPSNNAVEVTSLRQRGVEVKQAQSTDEAMALLGSGLFGAVVSDMGRFEGGRFISRAGLQLLEEMRQNGLQIPFLVYTSPSTASRQDALVKERGGDGATASPVDLMEWISRTLSPSEPTEDELRR